MLPAVCFLSAVWPQTPTTQATLYQRPDCWKRFLVSLVKDVIKPPGTYFNNWLQLSCRSSKFSSPFPATSVLLYALLDPVREPAKCFTVKTGQAYPPRFYHWSDYLKNESVSVKRRLRTRGKMQTECKMKTLGRHLHQIQGNWAGRNFVTESRVNSRLITHARM